MSKLITHGTIISNTATNSNRRKSRKRRFDDAAQDDFNATGDISRRRLLNGRIERTKEKQNQNEKCEFIKKDGKQCNGFKARNPPKGPRAHACAKHVDAWNKDQNIQSNEDSEVSDDQ